jgi:hypothetical protein
MSDMGINPGQDTVIDLDLGGIDAIHGWMPVPSGAYTLQIEDANVVPTKKGGRQIEYRIKVADGPLNGRSIGVQRVYVPDRNAQTPEAYQTTAGYFKGKMESINGQAFSGRLNVREQIGMKFKGVVVLMDDGFGPKNEINVWLPLSADISGISVPTPPAPRPSQQQNGGGQPQDAAAAARFRI